MSAAGASGFSLRPLPAQWFELLTARDDVTLAVETLARTGSVELETHSEPTTPLTMPDLHGRMEEYHRIAQRFHAYWPAHELRPSTLPGSPAATLEGALTRLGAWRREAEPLVERLEALESERDDLRLLGEFLALLRESPLRLALWPQAGPAVAARLLMLPRRTPIHQLPPGVIVRQVEGRAHDFLLALGPPREVETLEQELALLKGRRLPLPAWLAEDAAGSLRALEARRTALEREAARIGEQIAGLGERHHLGGALGDIARLEWFLTHVEALPVSENFAWVTGWTSDLEGARLRPALEEAGVRGLLRFPAPPRGKNPPMVLRNPWWARPFELFARLLGTPARDEADPSRLLVVVVPLMFGYMFGDIGQGAVLLLAGLALRRRWPVLALLIPGGAASIAFGALFGSIFSREDLLPALWLHPIDAPVTVLLFPLFAGMGLLLLGLLLAGVQARWRGEARRWWQQEAAIVLLYGALVAALLWRPALWLAALALPWYVAGSLLGHRGRRLAGLAADLGHLLESGMQLGVNTLSFARVGAFALAHTGLSAAVVALADASGHPLAAALVMVLGNAVIIVLEGLVVSIQITRLVLFEFFIRFLRGEGRGFRPLAAPPGGPSKPSSRSHG